MRERPRRSCATCAAATTAARGVYLELLYPLERFCTGCGRRERFCECAVVATRRAA